MAGADGIPRPEPTRSGGHVAPAFTLRFAHEYLLWFYKKGKLVPVASQGAYTTVIHEPSTVHSRKPNAAYELIEALYPTRLNRIELFARQRRANWESWGNEL